MNYIWKDATEFENIGGFNIETQFAQEMGQGYLFACCDTPGVPVKPCSGKITVEEDGMYRVWIRTKNWYPSHSPGKLKVLLDGKYLGNEIGALPISAWYFEVVGDIKLAKGEHTIKVEDTTGYFGRFSSIIVTDDMDFVPSSDPTKMREQRAEMKNISLVNECEEEFDVVVAGAGPGGVPAAIAAARKGMKVALLNSRPVLGGNSSNEGTVGFDGAYVAHANMRETGVADEIRRIRDFNQISWQAALEILVEKEPNITIFKNNFVIDAKVEDGVIKTVTALDCINAVMTIYKGKMFIDATGDGWLAYYSGAKYRIGREAKWQHGEEFAPEVADSDTMSGCLMGTSKGRQLLGYYAEEQEEDVPFVAPDWAVKLPEGKALYREPNRMETGEWWIENPNNYDDLWEQERVRDELLRLNLGFFHWLKNSYHRRDVVRKHKIVGFGKYNAKRETRRIMGDYIMTQNDCKGARFEDAIAYCGWSLDVHHPKGILSGHEGPFYANAKVPVTHFPFRCIYSKNIKNLMMAGRCASVTHLALGTARIQNTIATMGQAAGTACAVCVKQGIYPRDIYNTQMKEFQQLLLKDGMFIPELKNADENDKARLATVTASSTSKVEPYITASGVEGEYHKITGTVAACMNLSKSPEYAKAKLKNCGDNTMLKVSLAKMKNTADYENMEILETIDFELEKGFEGMAQFPFKFGGIGAVKENKDATNNVMFDSFSLAIVISVEEDSEVCWKRFDFTSFTKTKSEKINDYRWQSGIPYYSNSYVFAFYDEEYELANCSPKNVINGYSRIVDKEQYAWVSDPKEALPQWIEIKLPEAVEVSEVQITYDTDLTSPRFSYLVMPTAKNTVKDYTVQVKVDGEYIEVASAKGNYASKCNHSFGKVTTDIVRVNVNATWGSESAKIFEIRVY